MESTRMTYLEAVERISREGRRASNETLGWALVELLAIYKAQKGKIEQLQKQVDDLETWCFRERP